MTKKEKFDLFAKNALIGFAQWQKGTIDAGIVPAPLDLKAEEMGLKRLLQMGSILPIPQAGFATSEDRGAEGATRCRRRQDDHHRDGFAERTAQAEH